MLTSVSHAGVKAHTSTNVAPSWAISGSSENSRFQFSAPFRSVPSHPGPFSGAARSTQSPDVVTTPSVASPGARMASPQPRTDQLLPSKPNVTAVPSSGPTTVHACGLGSVSVHSPPGSCSGVAGVSSRDVCSSKGGPSTRMASPKEGPSDRMSDGALRSAWSSVCSASGDVGASVETGVLAGSNGGWAVSWPTPPRKSAPTAAAATTRLPIVVTPT